ncbi:uncharacterized protein LOC125639390 isoform X1 [Caretta caretta]|uniref:uncharacterized protein LOC125639390 isoform X1 n=1 Tax=Caretta caretta TaxID=8467 RepID=UPI003F4C8CCF
MLCCKPLFTPTSFHLQPTTLAHAVPWLPQDSGPWIMRSMGTCKYTEDQGKKLGVVGWVKNTSRGTVTGQVQGPKEKIEIMGHRNLPAHPPSPVATGKGRRGNFRSNGSVTFRDDNRRQFP